MARRPILFSRRGRVLALLVAAGTLTAGMVVPSAQAEPPVAPVVDPFTATGLPDVDTRARSVAPTAAQQAAAAALGATVRWNRFGTPQSLVDHGGNLGVVGSAADAGAAEAARSWLDEHRAIFGGGAAWAAGLELVQDQELAGGKAGSAVLFRQTFGGLPAAVDGLVTVGIKDGTVSYVSSSIAKTTAAPATASLSATDAWRAAAANVGRPVAAGAIRTAVANPDTGWTTFAVDGFVQVQQARLRALPSPDGTVVAVYEANVVDVAGGTVQAYTSFVDARTGAVLVRHNKVDNLGVGPQSEYSEIFEGAITETACGPRHPFEVDAATQTIVVSASAAVATNDIVLLLYDPDGEVVASQDTGTSPEALAYTGEIVAGAYKVEVCPFDDPTVPFTEPGDYVGVFTASEAETPEGALPYPPVWDYFLANPPLNYDPGETIDNRATGCWKLEVEGDPVPGCDDPPGDLDNLAARGPWDTEPGTGISTFTTDGNAASTAEAWFSPLTPGGLFQRPVELDRRYEPAFTDAWNNARCNQSVLVPGGNDILAAVTSLFSSHNRMHDYSYFLGFTEENYNLQRSNFGLGGQPGDPEIGNVQAGAITGGPPEYLGRDNANQITLQDGVPGITNQYLFQPIAGAFYAPCVDGDFDMSIVGHEYTHAISNRMVGGPDANLTGFQAGSMGESWSDQVALEYLFSHSYDQGTSPWVVGPYATGNAVTGIRNYPLDANPLQYGDLGYDLTGPEVHADGEVWSAVMWDVRQALVNKYDARRPYDDADLQRRCAEGNTRVSETQPPLSVRACPGNRRWIQLMFDSFLLQQAATSMIDARDAFLAADQMRFNGKNQRVIWRGFAGTGMGENASTTSTEDDQPVPDYTSPLAEEGTVTFTAMTKPGGDPIVGKIYVGHYEARVTPIADTDPETSLDAEVDLVPGRYDFVFQADGYGLHRFSKQVGAGDTIQKELKLGANLASAASGAVVDGASVGSLNTSKLIDDTEASNWAGINPVGASVDTVNPLVNVDLAGEGPQTIRSVVVSAMLRPADPAQYEDPEQPDAESGSRFTALRQFAIEVCTESITSDCSSLLPAGAPLSPYTRVFTSAVDAFDGAQPRPLAPDLLFRRFRLAEDATATHVRLVALENQCSGAPEYAGEQDDDPFNATDCKAASTRDESVRAAELQVFTK